MSYPRDLHVEVTEPLVALAADRFAEKWPIWSDSWRDGSYTDRQNIERLYRAQDDLAYTLAHYRMGMADIAALRVKAADVFNQLAMLVDPVRLTGTPIDPEMLAEPDDDDVELGEAPFEEDPA